MYYFIMRDDVANQLTPVFQQNSFEAAVRSIKRDSDIVSLIDDFSIALIGSDVGCSTCEEVSFAVVAKVEWQSLKEFVEQYENK